MTHGISHASHKREKGRVQEPDLKVLGQPSPPPKPPDMEPLWVVSGAGEGWEYRLKVSKGDF